MTSTLRALPVVEWLSINMPAIQPAHVIDIGISEGGRRAIADGIYAC